MRTSFKPIMMGAIFAADWRHVGLYSFMRWTSPTITNQRAFHSMARAIFQISSFQTRIATLRSSRQHRPTKRAERRGSWPSSPESVSLFSTVHQSLQFPRRTPHTVRVQSFSREVRDGISAIGGASAQCAPSAKFNSTDEQIGFAARAATCAAHKSEHGDKGFNAAPERLLQAYAKATSARF